jgi:hypothetical protein
VTCVSSEFPRTIAIWDFLIRRQSAFLHAATNAALQLPAHGSVAVVQVCSSAIGADVATARMAKT